MRVSSPEYVDYVMTWIEGNLDNPRIFPTLDKEPWPENFENYIQDIFRRMFRIFAIIFHRSLDEIEKIHARAHLNTVFKHFMFFCFEFKLIDEKETAALKGPVEKLREEYNRSKMISY
jgi:MOB kinase activator 1